MLLSSPRFHTAVINPGRYLRVLRGDWAGTMCARRGAAPRRAGGQPCYEQQSCDQEWLACFGTTAREEDYLDAASAQRGDHTVFRK